MNDTFSCTIVDDEPKAAELLNEVVRELYGNIIVNGVYHSWQTAYAALKANEPDILFLDIQMPQKNGMDMLKLLPELKSEIIFVTAFSDQALQAFNFSASGYILKPINDAMLVKAIDKAIERIRHKRTAAQKTTDLSHIASKIGIPNNKGTDYINIDSIIYLEATKRYTSVVTAANDFLSSYSIGKFKEMLEGHEFYQIHRSFIINLNYVKRYESSGIVIMSNGKEIPVSKNAKDEFLQMFERISK